MLADKVGKQLGRPTYSLTGWLVTKFLKWHNGILEQNAVKLSNIQPVDTVLELGHGPGLGLQAASKLLTGPKGKLLGVDYSVYMHQMASELMKEQIAKGRVILHCCDLAAMPIAENSVDKVFHCNCYYFWPDLNAGASAIHRVMKPGGIMVTTLNLDSVIKAASMKILSGENWRPEVYMEALQSSGFKDVQMKSKRDKFVTFQAIFATAVK
ncbi:uncharacterized methyltransferase YdaC [Xyrauchen texanus]|uniref:uncharacterized methyltransferase YdaC n=1 Tax=Xyrauchen texanus TaxID=154827 RepID=UPI002241B900|nr:uncharacterized methyltransferase YdaC [Xyrauchen texanus]